MRINRTHRRPVTHLLLGAAVLLLAGCSQDSAVMSAAGLSPVGYRPEQPIAFDHKIHAGENEIPCLFCHSTARRSTVAGVPSVQACMGCHDWVQSDHPELEKLTEYSDNAEPIPWVRVHSVPDFVRFTHKRHIKAGVACQSCHGPVEEMERVERVQSLEMGWCVQCHEQRGASIDCATCHY